MAVTVELAGSLGSINVGLSAAVGFLFPLGAQIDALLGMGLGPLEADLAVQFNAALSASATIGLQIGNPIAALELALGAVAQLQAALQAALALPPIQLSLSAELGASAALAAALQLKLGGLQLLIQAALAIKIPAVRAAAGLQAALTGPGCFLISFTGDTLAATGGALSGMFSSGITYGGDTIASDQVVHGIVLAVADPSVYASMKALFAIG